jgi:hypothetical protein
MQLRVSKHVAQVVFVIAILLGSAVAALGLQSSAIVATSGSILYPPEAKVLFKDSFESGDFRAWSGTYATDGDEVAVASASPYEGTYDSHFRTNPIPTGSKYAYAYITLSQLVSEVYARAYFFIVSGLPLDDSDDRFGLIGFEVSGQLQTTFRVHRFEGADRFSIIGFNGSRSVQKSTDLTYPVAGQWYSLEVYIKVHGTSGEYRAWINGVEQIAMTNLNTTRYGSGVGRVRIGLTASLNVQHSVEVHVDSVAVSTRYIGQLFAFGVIGSATRNPAIRNLYWLLGNQSISYRVLSPSEVNNLADIDLFDGLVVWTKQEPFNDVVIRQFARTRVVISDIRDFAQTFYSSLATSATVVRTSSVTYRKEWGPFRSGDLVYVQNETGNNNQLMAITNSALASFVNVTTIAGYDLNQVAYFHMNGTRPKSGFYVMDLDATTAETECAGIWHLFPPIKMVRDFPTGKYARWFAIGTEHWTYDQVMARLRSWVANAPRGMNASLVRIGKSVLGRDINATRFGNGSRYIVIDASIHGNEKNPTAAVLRLLEVIQENYEANGYWRNKLNEVSVIVIPILNPDGYVSNTRYNANNKDLNDQFPPQTTTEPEAWALRWLWGNCSTIIYVNLHEGRHWQPLDYFYATNYTTTTVDVKGFSWQNIHWTGDDFASLRHWGYYDEGSWSTNPLPIGEVRLYSRHIGNGQADIGASYLHNSSAYLVESFVWSSSYNGTNHKARQMLWAMDYYIATVLGFVSHLDRLRQEDFLIVTQGNIKSFTWTDKLRLEIDSSQLPPSSNCTTKIDVGTRAKPLSVVADGRTISQDQGWTYSNGLITITCAKNRIEIGW